MECPKCGIEFDLIDGVIVGDHCCNLCKDCGAKNGAFELIEPYLTCEAEVRLIEMILDYDITTYRL